MLNSTLDGVSKSLIALQREMRSLASVVAQMKAARVTATVSPETRAAMGRTPETVRSGTFSPQIGRALDRPTSPVFVGPTSSAYGLKIADSSLNDMGFVSQCPSHGSSMSPPHIQEARSREPSAITISQAEVLRLMEVYRKNVQLIYPFLDIDALENYAVETFRNGVDCNKWEPIGLDGRRMRAPTELRYPVLKLILACSMVVEGHGHSDLAAETVDSVSGMMGARIKIPEMDLDELVILTLTVRILGEQDTSNYILTLDQQGFYHFFRDQEFLAWRFTGMAMRGAMEIGLHRRHTWLTTRGNFPGNLRRSWALNLFWCIYVLDRKYSLDAGLPFAIQDSDIDTELPEMVSVGLNSSFTSANR